MDIPIDVRLEWGREPAFEVEHTDDGVVVRADARLSEAQVKVACEDIVGGDRLYQAWRTHVGLDGEAP
jgi:hypothetical protein